MAHWARTARDHGGLNARANGPFGPRLADAPFAAFVAAQFTLAAIDAYAFLRIRLAARDHALCAIHVTERAGGAGVHALAGLARTAPPRRGNTGRAPAVADLARGAVVTAYVPVEPACARFAIGAVGVAFLIDGTGVDAETVLFYTRGQRIGDADITGDPAAAALGAEGEAEFARQRLTGGLFGFARSAIGSADTTVRALIHTDPVDDVTAGRATGRAGVIAGLSWRTTVVAETRTRRGARGRLGSTGETIVVASTAVGTSIPADPLLLVTGDLDAGRTFLVAGRAERAIVGAHVVDDGAGVYAFGAVEVADLVLGTQRDALARRIASAIVLDTFIALIVAEIAFGAFVDALPVSGPGAEDRLELTGQTVFCAAKARIAIIEAAIATQATAIVRSTGVADGHAHTAGVVTARPGGAIVHAPVFGVAATLDGDAGHACTVAARAGFAGLEANIGV